MTNLASPQSVSTALPTAVRAREYIVSASHGADMALLDPVKGHYYTLNTVGARIWQLLCLDTPPMKIAALLRREFDAPDGAIENDLTRLLHELTTAQLADVV